MICAAQVNAEVYEMSHFDFSVSTKSVIAKKGKGPWSKMKMDMKEEGSPSYFDPSDLFASIRQTQNSKLENQKNVRAGVYLGSDINRLHIGSYPAPGRRDDLCRARP